MDPEMVEGFRLSPQQRRLWRLQQADSGRPYRTCAAVTIRGPLDDARLEQAIHLVVARHEILRTSFQLLPGLSIPVQVIATESSVSLVRHDISALHEAGQRAYLESVWLDTIGQQGGAAQLPVVCGALVKQSTDEHRLIVGMPALCADRPSVGRFVAQVAEACAALSAGAPVPECDAMQYADFAEWRNQLLEGDAAAAAREHWAPFEAARADAPTLPFESPHDASPPSFRPATVPVPMSADAAARLTAVAVSRGLSISSMLLACWQTLIWRVTGRTDAVVGTAFDGRKVAELDAAIGLLTTFVPIRTSIDDTNLTLAAMAAAIANRERDASRLQEYFAAEERGYFAFCFELHQGPAAWSGAGLVFAIERQYAPTDRFKVKVCGELGAGGFSANLEFDSNVLPLEHAERLAAQFGRLIEDAGHRPETALGDLEIIGGAERQRLLVEFNQSGSVGESVRVIHELFEERAAQTPEATAVVYEGDQLTYRELNARANQLAHHLIDCGVGPDVPVGLCVERSTALIVGLLGILKAGGAYVPMDPGLPKSRLGVILEQARIAVVVTTSTIEERVGGATRRVVRLDVDGDLLRRRSRSDPPRRVAAQNLVYVIFTSGSTGTPKGVAVEHRQLVNYVDGITAALGVSAASFAMISTVAADLGNTALFPALAMGGTLHLISDARATDPDRLSEYFEQHAIDCLKIVPSHLAALLTGSNPAGVLPRRRLVLGGDTCAWSLAQRVAALAPETVLFNHYGPTEATVGAIAAAIDFSDPGDASSGVPLGRPLAGVRAYILDRRLRLAPLGVAGELYIGGGGVARGYVERPDATAERFLPDAFGSEPGARLYKTGDRARYRADGRIEFLGRGDEQVKVHGYRVEPAEIEAALRAYPGIVASVVMPRQDGADDTTLVAYVVAPDAAPPAADLRAFLRERLPEYMVPAAFVVLDRLPLTPNGKVDRLALPAEHARPTEGRLAAPRTAAEQTLADIWSAVLRVTQVGIHDNFFELGGDSILSIQIIARASQAGLRLSPRQLFQHQTIAELASVAGTSAAAVAAQGVVTGDVPLTPVQARFFELDAPVPHHYNQARLLEVERVIDGGLVERALDHLVRHHDALRLRAVHTGAGWRQRIVPPDAPTPFERIDLSGRSESEQRTAVATHAARVQASLNLETGPIVSAAWFELGAERNPQLLIVIHHLAVDVVSWRILLDDLEALLRGTRDGATPVLPGKTTSFKTWAERITEHARSGARHAELPHWLSVPRTVTGLPVDRAGGDNTAASARTVSVALSAEETKALLQDVSVAYRTQINDVLLTALVRVLAPWTGSSSLLLDLEGHGREEVLEDIDVSRTVGWFTTIFPVHLEGGDAATPGETIRAVKERLRAVPDRGIGYGLLRYASGDAAAAGQLRALPQAQVRFNYFGRVDRANDGPALFRVAEAAGGPAQSPAFPRTYLLNIIASVTGDALRVEWTYSAAIHDRATVERLAQQYLAELRLLIAAGDALAAVSLTPSDFPAARLSQGDLDKVLSRIKGAPGGRGH